jgi:methylmalonyl-CoA mutase N-terminal domain/subunit
VIVGVNRFVDEEVSTPSIARIDPAREKEQVASLTAFRAARNAAAAAAALAAIQTAAKGGTNLMPLLIDGVKAGLTVGEISGGLREIWGEYRESLVL